MGTAFSVQEGCSITICFEEKNTSGIFIPLFVLGLEVATPEKAGEGSSGVDDIIVKMVDMCSDDRSAAITPKVYRLEEYTRVYLLFRMTELFVLLEKFSPSLRTGWLGIL